jgi:hypothetical protein
LKKKTYQGLTGRVSGYRRRRTHLFVGEGDVLQIGRRVTAGDKDDANW